jgi:tetratricopeptide (TPR) repeat protein
MRAAFVVAAFFLVLTTRVSRAQAPPAGAADYLEGLTSLGEGKFGDAVTQMGRAVDADEENPDYRIGRAVALIFSEKMADAEKDLQRALKLRPNDRSARMWLASAAAMQGDFQHDSDIYPFATFGASFDNAVRAMSHHYGQYGWELAEARRVGGGQVGAQTRADYANAKAQFPILARQFATNAEVSLQANNPALAGVVRDRALARVQQKDYAGALPDITRLMSSTPDDPQMMNAQAQCLLALGNPFLARAEATRVLTQELDNADAFATRAVAAATMGDQHRADSDLKIIAQIAPAKLEEVQAAVSAAEAQSPPGFKANELVARVNELHQLAADHKPWDALVSEAISINKGQNDARRHFDEDYQDRLRGLTLAAQNAPRDAEALAAMGKFLYDGAIDVPGEAVEPRAQFRSYRLLDQRGQQQELARAGQSLDAALSIDARNMLAITSKAELLIHDGQWGDAETLIRQALAIKPSDPRLLDLFARVMDYAASVRNYKAAQLRTPRTWIGGMYIWTWYPSQSELDAADQYDQQADQLWNIANNAMQSAAQALKGTAEGFNYASVIASRNDNIDEAIADLQSAVKLAPENAEYHDALAGLYDQKGEVEAAANERTIGVNLVQTTAAPLLRLAWQQIPRTLFKSARETLNRAIALDAADSRSTAYLGMIAADDSKLDEAGPWMTAAAALDEAEGRFEGRSATSSATGAVPPSRIGLGMSLDLKAAGFDLQQKQPQLAAAMLQLAIAAGSRVPTESLYTPTASSMLPDSNVTDNSVQVPPAHSVGTMLAWAHLYLGRALIAESKADDAIAQYRDVLALQSAIPPTVDGGTEIRNPVAYAAYSLAYNAMQHNQPKAALDYLNGRGPTRNGSTQKFWQAYNDLFEKARLAYQNNQMEGTQNSGYPQPNQPQSSYPPGYRNR